MAARRRRDQLELFHDAGRGAGVRRVRAGVDATIKALRSGGRLEPVDAATVALARTLADALDDEHADPDGSRFVVATLAGKLEPIVEVLRGERIAGFDEIDELLAAMAQEGPA